MAKKSTSPFVPGVGGTHASKVMQSLSSSPSNLPGWVSLYYEKKGCRKWTFLETLLLSNVTSHLSISVICFLIHSGRMLNTPNTPTSTFTQRQLPSVSQPAPPITHPMAVIPHQPSYRAPTDRIFYLAHTCQPACLNRVRPAKPDIHRGKNPLLTPLLYDFRRMTGRRKVNRKVKCTTTWQRAIKYVHLLLCTSCDVLAIKQNCSTTPFTSPPTDVFPCDLQGSLWPLFA